MSEPTVPIRKIWGPEDYAETMRAAAQHRAEPGIEAVVTKATENEIVIKYRPEPCVCPPGLPAGVNALCRLHHREGVPAEAMEPDVDPCPGCGATNDCFAWCEHDADDERPLPFRRNPARECPSCWVPAGIECDLFCLSRLTPEQQIAHRDAVIDRTLADLDLLDEIPSPNPDPAQRRRRGVSVRRIVAVLALLAVLAVGVMWAAGPAKAETFDICPSRLSGVVTADTSCAFADSVRAAYYVQPGMTIYAWSPTTSLFYTMTCRLTATDTWYSAKRCVGLNPFGAVLIVYVA